MKKILLLLVVITAVSCKNEGEAEVKTAPTHQEVAEQPTVKSDLNLTSQKSDVTFEDENFTKVYASYLALKGALVNTDAASAAGAAGKLLISLSSIENEGLTKSLNELTTYTDVNKQRVVFEKITAAMEVEIGKNTITSGQIYKQYCPMAFKGKGAYWLSDSKEVRNPYFGDQMLTCGVVDSEIK